MSGNKNEDEAISIIRSKLNKERVKLWLAPYTVEDDAKGVYPEEMIRRYATELNLSEDLVAVTFEQLRKHSLEKLASRRKFQETGITVLTIKLTGKLKLEKSEFSLEIGLQVLGEELRQKISALSNIPTSRLKLIGCGHVIVDERTLYDQHIRPESHIMAIVLSESEAEAQAKQEEQRRLEETRRDAEIISEQSWGKNSFDESYIQIADQSGKPLNLPREESKALTLAMTLHEQGRSAILRKEYGYALLILLEADEEFNKCRSSILNTVDNYALLCLDISWCYLCLRSMKDLPDADVRLRNCEQCLHQSYGANYERLVSVKGSIGNAKALLLRLHLLQGIVAFHQQQYERALRLLNIAECEAKALQIDDNKLSRLMAMGYKATEARLALRTTQGDMEKAVSLIIEKQKERERIRLKEEEEKKKRAESRKLGRTDNGEWVKVDVYNMLLDMGFLAANAKQALRQANNDISAAIQLLHQPELLNFDEPGPSGVHITEIEIAQVASFGFDPEIARQALIQFKGDLQKAVDVLAAAGGILPEPSSEQSDTSLTESSSSTTNSIDEIMERKKRELEAYERLKQDIPEHEEAYLDITLEEETQFIEEYKTKLAQLQGHF